LVNSEIELTDSFRRDELSFAINSLTLIDFAAIRNNAELMKINIHLNKGDVKQISGRSGFGKSSILEGMIGNLPTVGSYLINSSDFEVKQLSEYSILLQNDHLFITSIRENFKIAKPEITDEEIWHLLSLVEMDHVIGKFTEELDLIIGNTNIPLSGGEIQRIKWARSLARKRQVYIWDEPCEYLDAALIARTLPKVIDEVMGEAKEAIVLIISHIDLISYLNIPV
jgi:ABC-type transport system involved in cytochrome bd biosynthesis fused ATPase/permease subunit